MVRVIIEHQAKDAKAAERIIEVVRELRNEAIKQPGYITGETLVNAEDPCNVLIISTWQKVENWKSWDTSEKRTKITQEIHPLLSEPYTVRTYHYHLARKNRVWSTY